MTPTSKQLWQRFDDHPLLAQVLTWIADQSARFEPRVLFDDSEDWSIEVAGIGVVRHHSDDPDADDATDLLTTAVGWDDMFERRVVLSLLVQGTVTVAPTAFNVWRIVGTEEPRRNEIAGARTYSIDHPSGDGRPWSVVAGLSTILCRLETLYRQAETQSKQRVLTSGIVSTRNVTGPPDHTGEATSFWDEWNRSLSAHMVGEEDLSPVRLELAADEEGPGVWWTTNPAPYDDKLARNIEAARTELIQAMPIPPEIVEGMQAQSRATAFQVDRASITQYVGPWAQRAMDVLAMILTDALDTAAVISVDADDTEVLSYKHSASDAFRAYELGVVTAEYLADVLGIPEHAVNPDPPPPIRSSRGDEGDEDVSREGTGEPNAAAGLPPDSLSEALAAVDADLAAALVTYAEATRDRLLAKLGAAARTHPATRETLPTGLTNRQAATHLGTKGLAAAGVDVARHLDDCETDAQEWWAKRLARANSHISQIVPGWEPVEAWAEGSILLWSGGLREWLSDAADDPDAAAPAGLVRETIDVAAGQADGVR